LLEKGHEVNIYNGEYGTKYLKINRVSERLSESKDSIQDPEAEPYRIFKQALETINPDIVGLSTYSQSLPVVLRLSSIIKQYSDKCLVVAGGPHATVDPYSLINVPSIDVAVMYEGEQPMLEIVEKYEHGKQDFEGIPGVLYRRAGEIHRNKPALRRHDLDQLPFPIRNVYLGNISDLTEPEKSVFIKRNNSVMITSRGCPYACKFCSCKNVWHRKVTYRSVENVIAELRKFYRQYGSTEMMFWDDSFTLKKERVIQFCQEYKKSNIPIPWKAQTRVNLIDYELVKNMRDAGCSTLYFGIESGSQRVLDIIDKQITIEQIHKAINVVERVGLTWACSFIFGVPGDTVEDMQKTLTLMKQINPSNISLLSFTPFPATEFYDFESVKKVLSSGKYDYFDLELFSEPRNFTGTMTDDDFHKMKKIMFDYVDQYNKKRGYLNALIEKVNNPVYRKHPFSLLGRAYEKWANKGILEGW
jgi:anaerobic magnesium-protoporphyrin IX monomethyl ester cyclase